MITFNDLGLHENILRAVSEMGYLAPTEIQEKAIPVFLERSNNLIALAQTGTGKTAAFGLPMLSNIDTNNPNIQGLVIAPTRELCLQITNDLKNYSKYLRNFKVVAVYGGSSISAQLRELKDRPQVIVATPGRLIDFLDRKAVNLEFVQTVVLDEADEMLNMGFQEDMESILSHTPDTKITGLFSATMSKDIRNIANKYIRNNVEVSAGKKNQASLDITHQYAVVHAKDKLAAVKRIIDFNEDFFGIVFCQTKIETQDISDALVKAGYNADCLHGDLSQQQRDKVMGRFRKHVISILCATDVAARGLDINDITHVIHYQLADDIENYTHRSGRTARAGKKGISIALLHQRELYKLNNIERVAGFKFEKFLIPNGQEIIGKRIENYISDFTKAEYENNSGIEVRSEWIAPLMEMEKEELISRILAKELAKIDTAYLENANLNVDSSTKAPVKTRERSSSSSVYDRDLRDRESRGSYESRERFDGGRGRERSSGAEAGTRLFINLGKKDNVRYDEIREIIFKNSRVSGYNVKDIEMKGVYSFFQTDERSAEAIISAFQNVEEKGRMVRVQRAEDHKDGEVSTESFSKRNDSYAPRRNDSYSDRKPGGYPKRESGFPKREGSFSKRR